MSTYVVFLKKYNLLADDTRGSPLWILVFTIPVETMNFAGLKNSPCLFPGYNLYQFQFSAKPVQ